MGGGGGYGGIVGWMKGDEMDLVAPRIQTGPMSLLGDVGTGLGGSGGGLGVGEEVGATGVEVVARRNIEAISL